MLSCLVFLILIPTHFVMARSFVASVLYCSTGRQTLQPLERPQQHGRLFLRLVREYPSVLLLQATYYPHNTLSIPIPISIHLATDRPTVETIASQTHRRPGVVPLLSFLYGPRRKRRKRLQLPRVSCGIRVDWIGRILRSSSLPIALCCSLRCYHTILC